MDRHAVGFDLYVVCVMESAFATGDSSDGLHTSHLVRARRTIEHVE
jgi:hypothetical protein